MVSYSLVHDNQKCSKSQQISVLTNLNIIESRSQQVVTLCIVLDLGESVLIHNILQHGLDDRFSLEVHALNVILKNNDLWQSFTTLILDPAVWPSW